MQGQQRHKGFVVGCDPGPRGSTIWKVRVNDTSSSYNGKKFIVASIHDDIALAQALNVDFAIGTVDGKKGKELRAVDVTLENP